MNYYIVRYFSGFKNYHCLIVASSQDQAMEEFYKSHPSVRAYNVLSVKETNSRVYQLAS